MKFFSIIYSYLTYFSAASRRARKLAAWKKEFDHLLNKAALPEHPNQWILDKVGWTGTWDEFCKAFATPEPAFRSNQGVTSLTDQRYHVSQLEYDMLPVETDVTVEYPDDVNNSRANPVRHTRKVTFYKPVKREQDSQ